MTPKERLIEFYRQYDPSKLSKVDEIYQLKSTSLSTFLLQLEKEFNCPRYFELSEYDFYSKDFSPLLALYDDNVVPPNPMARPFDNIHKAQILLNSKSEDVISRESCNSIAIGQGCIEK